MKIREEALLWDNVFIGYLSEGSPPALGASFVALYQ